MKIRKRKNEKRKGKERNKTNKIINKQKRKMNG